MRRELRVGLGVAHILLALAVLVALALSPGLVLPLVVVGLVLVGVTTLLS